jgi:hypothetical protein
MKLALAGRGRRNGWGEEDVLNIVHDNPSASTRHIFCRTGRLSQRASSHTLCVVVQFILFIYNQCKSCRRGHTSLSTVYWMTASIKVCAVEGHDG